MSSVQSITIVGHTTASTPSPHVLYALKVTLNNGHQYKILRRYSHFVNLQECLLDTYSLPSKHHITNSIVPFAWVNDCLISERKSGLAAYLNYINAIPEFQNNENFIRFLSPTEVNLANLSNKFPPMVSRNMATISNMNEPGTQVTPIAAAYYPSWSSKTNPPNKIDFSKFDIIFYAFITPNSSSTITWDDNSQSTLRALVSSIRLSGKTTKVVLSIGGWGGSHWFSKATSNASNRSKFNNSLVDAVNTFGLDGVDIDWEYPNSEGAGNPHAPRDAANLLSLLKLLRASLGPSKIISSAVTHMPWIGPDGNPLSDISAFAAQVTYVNIMNYDVFGASSKPGPNAPLGNLCRTSSQPRASAQAALSQWTKAGMPASKILLGLPLYSYVCKSTAKKLSGSLMSDSSVHSIPHPRGPLRDISTAPAGDLSSMWGQQIAFNQLLRSGALEKKADGTYTGGNGYTMAWDDCSDTPFLYNVSRSTVVTYDDTRSLASKAGFAMKFGMAGCLTWSLDQDDGVTLQNVIRSSLSKE